MFKDYSKTMGYVVLTILILSALGGVLNIAGVFSERIIVKNSFQYKEGMAQQASIWESQIISVENQMLTADAESYSQLEGQLRLLKAQLKAITINQ